MKYLLVALSMLPSVAFAGSPMDGTYVGTDPSTILTATVKSSGKMTRVDLSVAEPHGCSGEVSVKGVIKNNSMTASGGEADLGICRVKFRFTGKAVDITPMKGCSGYSGFSCEFSGTAMRH